jgi:NADH-quinone oxidoreductase subunit A
LTATLVNPEPLWPLVVYFGLVVLVAAGIVGMSYVLGQRHKERATDEPYESGIAITSTARLRVPIRFYLVAFLFVLFDLESVFIFAWAVCVRQAGWAGYIEIAVFIGVLLAALLYVVRQGALDWGKRPPPSLGTTGARKGEELV